MSEAICQKSKQESLSRREACFVRFRVQFIKYKSETRAAAEGTRDHDSQTRR